MQFVNVFIIHEPAGKHNGGMKMSGGYLFVYFIGENEDPVELAGEQIYMSVSRDGLHWKDLQSKPVLKSGLGMKGVRDPYAVRDPKTGRVYLIATDLRIDAGEGWDTAQYRGSRDIIIWESDDLVHWSKERAFTAAMGLLSVFLLVQ